MASAGKSKLQLIVCGPKTPELVLSFWAKRRIQNENRLGRDVDSSLRSE